MKLVIHCPFFKNDFFKSSPKDMLIDLREREAGRKTDGQADRHQYEKHRSVVSHMCPYRGANLQLRHLP